MKTVPSSDLPNSSTTRRARTIGAAPRRRGVLKIADGYLLRHMIEATMRGLLWFAGLLMTVTVIDVTRRLFNSSLDFAGMLRLLASELPRVFLFTMPMSILFGTVQTFSDLSSRGEATALQIGGMTLGRMMRAPLAWGALVGVFVFVLQEFFVPRTQQNRQKVIAAAIRNSGAVANFQFTDPPDGPSELIVDAKLFDPANGRMTKPSLKFFDADGGIQSFVAERGVWNIQTGQWTLYNVESGQVSKPGKDATGTGGTFKEMNFKIPSPQALTNKTTTLRQHFDKGNFELAAIPDLMRYRADLQNELRTQDSARRAKTNLRINAATYGIHDKIATPWLCVFLVLVGAPLALRPQRASGGFSMGLSLAVLIGYYVMWSAAQGIGRGGNVNPVVTGYFPVSVTLLVGLVMLWKKSR